ncbi:capsule assembly Wzi family protein [Candidatus Latescibacterota bacterium]
MIKKYLLSALLVMLFSAGNTVEASSYVPIDHRAYDFLERMEVLYLIDGAHLGTRPFTRSAVAALLLDLGDIKGRLSRADREEFDCLMVEFSPDIPGRNGLAWDDHGPLDRVPGFLRGYVYRNRRNLLSTAGDSYSLYLDPVISRRAVIGSDDSGASGDRVYTSGNGLILRGTVGNNIGFHVDVRDSKEWGSHDYPEAKVTTMPGRGYVSFKGDRAEFDETEAHISYSGGPFVVSLGRGRNFWGRGSSGTLGLSGHASSYDMVRLETGFWRLKFMFFAAELEQYPPLAKFYYNVPSGVIADSVAVKKYMSGHRVELNVTDRFSLGLYETIVYGGRWDASYLNPLMFMTGAEHWNGDHDNAALGMDFRLSVHRGHSVYGEFLVDDITTSKLGTDWYGNKFGWQLGTYLVEPFGFRNVDFRIEYSKIKPWAYTHKFPVNGYNHYGDVLGYYSGPNSDVIYVSLRKRFSRRLHSALSIIKRRHGRNPDGSNIGGDPLDGFSTGDLTSSGFLDGVLDKNLSTSLDVSYELFWQLFVRAGITFEDRDNDSSTIYRLSIGLNE